MASLPTPALLKLIALACGHFETAESPDGRAVSVVFPRPVRCDPPLPANATPRYFEGPNGALLDTIDWWTGVRQAKPER